MSYEPVKPVADAFFGIDADVYDVVVHCTVPCTPLIVSGENTGLISEFFTQDVPVYRRIHRLVMTGSESADNGEPDRGSSKLAVDPVLISGRYNPI